VLDEPLDTCSIKRLKGFPSGRAEKVGRRLLNIVRESCIVIDVAAGL